MTLVWWIVSMVSIVAVTLDCIAAAAPA